MPSCKRDLTKKYICQLEPFGCKGFWGNNVTSYPKHCTDDDTHKGAHKEQKVQKGTEKEEKKEDKKIVQLTILPDIESIYFFGAIPKRR